VAGDSPKSDPRQRPKQSNVEAMERRRKRDEVSFMGVLRSGDGTGNTDGVENPGINLGYPKILDCFASRKKTGGV